MGHRNRRRAGPNPRERDVRMKCAHILIEPEGDEHVVDFLSQLKQQRMRSANAHPNDFRGTARRKRADAFEGKKKWRDADLGESCGEPLILGIIDIADEPESDVQLFDRRPREARLFMIKFRQLTAVRVRQGEGDKSS
jgi:hypothetical protein